MTRKISNSQGKSLTSYSQIAIVTGAGAGIGLQTALLLAEKGIRVYAMTRTPASLATLDEKVAAHGLNHYISTLCLDVTTQKQREDVKNIILDRESEHLYSDKPPELILINNAGIGSMGSAEETPPEELQKVIDTNFYGAVEMTRLFLPVMRQNRQGKIIQVSSGYGKVGAPLMSAYCASKFALEGYSESLRYELLPFNLFVTLVEPGPVLTNFRDKMGGESDKTNSPYQDIHLAFNKILEKGKKWLENHFLECLPVVIIHV